MDSGSEDPREDPKAEGRLGNVAAALLVGGASSRMGQSKALLELDGQPMASRAATLLDVLFDDVLVVGGNGPLGGVGRWIPDVGESDEPRSALRGIVTALEAAHTDRVVIVATDLPFLTAELVLALSAWPEHDAVVPRDSRGTHPLCAIYRREPVLAAARERLAAGRFKLEGLLDAVDTDYIEGADLALLDPDERALTNVNTPEDLRDALTMLDA